MYKYIIIPMIYVLLNATTGQLYPEFQYSDQGQCQLAANNLEQEQWNSQSGQNDQHADTWTCTPVGNPLPRN